MIPISVKPTSERRPGMISVLMPSRHRPTMLAASVRSLRERATRPDLLELLVAHDPDDQQTGEHARQLGAEVVWQAPERYGYPGSARYYAALIGHARGEWCLPSWGDDGLMRTDGWDDIVRAQPPPSVLYTTGGDKWGNNCFPVVHMDVFVATGRFCDIPPIDTWYDEVGKLAGIWRTPDPPIVLEQDRYDLTGNNHDRTYIEGSRAYWARGLHPREFYAPKWQRWRQEDAQRVVEMLRSQPRKAMTHV